MRRAQLGINGLVVGILWCLFSTRLAQTGIRGGSEFSLTLVAFVLLVVSPFPDPFLCRITAVMGSVVAGDGVNPADQRWPLWPLLPLTALLPVQI